MLGALPLTLSKATISKPPMPSAPNSKAAPNARKTHTQKARSPGCHGSRHGSAAGTATTNHRGQRQWPAASIASTIASKASNLPKVGRMCESRRAIARATRRQCDDTVGVSRRHRSLLWLWLGPRSEGALHQRGPLLPCISNEQRPARGGWTRCKTGWQCPDGHLRRRAGRRGDRVSRGRDPGALNSTPPLTVKQRPTGSGIDHG